LILHANEEDFNRKLKVHPSNETLHHFDAVGQAGPQLSPPWKLGKFPNQFVDSPNLPETCYTPYARLIDRKEPMIMDLDDYVQRTRSANRVEARAQQEGARFRLKHGFNEQCLLALVRESFGTAARTLRASGVDLAVMRREIEDALRASPDEAKRRTNPLSYRAYQEKKRLESRCLETTHLLLAALQDDDELGPRLLRKQGANVEHLRRQLEQLSGDELAREQQERPSEDTNPFRSTIKALRDPDPSVRAKAVLSLQTFSFPSFRGYLEAIPDLILCLSDTNCDVKATAAHVLSTFGNEAKASIPALLTLLNDTETVRYAAIKALVQIDWDGNDANASFDAALKDVSARVRLQAACLLWKRNQQPREILPIVADAVADPSAAVRCHGLELLQAMGIHAVESVPLLIRLLKGPDKSVRRAAAAALEKLGVPAQAALLALIECLDDDDPLTFLTASRAIRKLRVRDSETLKAVLAALSRASSQRQSTIFCLLQNLGPAADWAVPQLIDALKDQIHSPRYLTIGAPGATGFSLNLASFFIDAIGAIGSHARVAAPLLFDLIGSSDRHVRLSAAEALWKIDRNREALRVVLTDLAGDNEDAAQHAAHAMARLDPAEATFAAALEAALTHPSVKVRVAAAGAYYHHTERAERVLPILTKALQNPDMHVVASAAMRLGWMKTDALPALPALRKLPHKSLFIEGAISAIDPQPIPDSYHVAFNQAEQPRALQETAAAPAPRPAAESDSIVTWTQALDADPDDTQALVFRGEAWSKMREDEKAIADFSRAIELDRDEALAYLGRAHVHHRVARHENAVADCTEALRVGPNCQNAFVLRGGSLTRLGKNEQGIADLNEAIRFEPEDASAYNWRGIAHKNLGNLEAALADYNRVLEITPNAFGAYLNRGLLFKSKGDFASAMANYLLALQFNPNYAVAYNNLAWLWSTCPDTQFRDGPKALEYANKACELSNWANCLHLFTLGGAYAEVGQFDQAVYWAKKALELAPKQQPGRVDELRRKLQCFEEGKPWRDEVKN
jgi:tetratricopeptide (TPR) repeat protein